MLSRCQSLDQLFILGEIQNAKLYADQKALQEVQRLEKVSLNNNPSVWNILDDSVVKVCFLNVRSIKRKFHWIEFDKHLQKADVIFLSETWLDLTDKGISLPDFLFPGRGGVEILAPDFDR